MSFYSGELYDPGPGGGQPGTFTLAGSGLAVPAGIDVPLEFNGLLMNVQANVDRYKITEIDGLHDADIRDTRDVNTDDDGETPFNAFYGGKTLVLNGEILTYSIPKLRDMQQALKFAFNDISQEYPLIFRTGDFEKDHYINCKKSGAISMIESQPDRRISRAFQITLRASNRRFLSFYERYTTSFPSVSSTNVNIFTPVNAGTAWADTRFRIYGPATNATITNDVTGKSFTVTNVPSGDYFEFEINGGRITLKNILGYNQWKNLADESEYIRLKGAAIGGLPNPIYYSGDSPRIDLFWHDSWI